MARFTNQAQLRYGNNITNSNVAVGEILEALSATKTAVRDTYNRNDSITYLVSIVNAGTLPITGLTLSDDLGAYTFGTAATLTPLTYIANTAKYYINGVLQATPAVTAGPPLTISGLTVPAGGNLLIVYDTMTNQYAPLTDGGTIENTVTINGGSISAITAQETVTAASAPLLTITKSVSPVPVTENGTLTYTFLIQNDGNLAADTAAAVVITDTFDPVLSNLTVTLNGTALTLNTDYVYDESTGVFATVAGRITVPAATYTQDSVTGEWITTPGTSTLVITGTV